MRIAPAPEFRVFAEIFDADIVSAYPGMLAIHHYDLAMIAIVDAAWPVDAQKLVSLVETGHFDARLAQLCAIALWHASAANVVIQQIDIDAGLGALDQPFRQFLAQSVVAHDVKLHQQVFLRLGDALEDGIEGRLAIDQNFYRIALEKRHFGDLGLHRPLVTGLAVYQRQILGPQWARGAAIANAVRGVIVERLPAQHQIQKRSRER